MQINQSRSTPTPQAKADLHIHSDQSDGLFSYKKIIDYSIKIGLKAISITDHDNISALGKTEKYAKDNGLEFIPGIEISAKTRNVDLHMLGYFIDYDNKSLVDYINLFQNERIKRAEKMVKRLNNCAIPLSFEAVRECAQNGSIGRPHIAGALLKEGLIDNYQEAFNKYIGDGRPCEVPKYKITPQEAIALINRAGGICILAHPGEDVNDAGIYDLIKVGLDGIETIHPRHTQKQVNFFRNIVNRYNLIETGGSDCHGKYNNDIFIGRMNVPYAFVEKMKERLGY
ncbi:PHP domain-containing protein [candidate division KSB1 bacterium]|nr:PHP domain-containing protein [candidate division KSB1 bacterium]MBL7092894.1 PHP domain-containing protein [candidate division KSB1 bacterium]